MMSESSHASIPGTDTHFSQSPSLELWDQSNLLLCGYQRGKTHEANHSPFLDAEVQNVYSFYLQIPCMSPEHDAQSQGQLQVNYCFNIAQILNIFQQTEQAWTYCSMTWSNFELRTQTNTAVIKAADATQITNHFRGPSQTAMQTSGTITSFLRSHSQTTNQQTPLNTVLFNILAVS